MGRAVATSKLTYYQIVVIFLSNYQVKRRLGRLGLVLWLLSSLDNTSIHRRRPRYLNDVLLVTSRHSQWSPLQGVATPRVRIRTYDAVLPEYIRTLLFG